MPTWRKWSPRSERLCRQIPTLSTARSSSRRTASISPLMTPVAHALEEHLRLLRDNGYRVVPAGSLKALSPFEDIDTGADYIGKLRALDKAGYVIGYKNNTFQPDRPLTHGEMLTMTLTKDDYSDFMKNQVLGCGYHRKYKAHPYFVAYQKYGLLEQLGRSGEPVSTDEVKRFFNETLQRSLEVVSKKTLPRREYIAWLPDDGSRQG